MAEWAGDAMAFEILNERAEGVLIVTVVGSLKLGAELRAASSQVRDAGDAHAILIDLGACTRVDSAGLGGLLMW